MTASRDPDRLIHAFVLEGEERLHDQVYDAVRSEIEQKRQRVVIGPWRSPTMNKIVGFGLAAAAVVAAVLIGAQLLGSPSNVGGPDVEPTPTAEPTATPEPTPSPAGGGLPEGPFLITGDDGPLDGGLVNITIDIPSAGWVDLSFDAVAKNDDGFDPPDSVGGAFLAWAFPPGTGFNVYGDPCRWSTTIPETPATTPDEIAAAFTAQAATSATEPEDVTIGGYTGKTLTLHVPMSYDVPGATREERFGDCDNDIFAFYGLEGHEEVDTRNAQGAGQVDELWILDVDGSIVILDASYSAATLTDIVEEMRAMAESATFDAR